jgi:hypothetical protein
VFRWDGEKGGALAGFQFREDGGPPDDAAFRIIINMAIPGSFMDVASGTWSITINDAQTPEPSAFLLALTGGVFLVARKRWAASRKELT